MPRGGPGQIRLNARIDGRYYRDAIKHGPAYLRYLSEVDRLITTMTASALESGMGNSEAVTLSVATYQEIEILARAANGDLLSTRALHMIYTYACAILASGTTFNSFEIAQRAIAAYHLSEAKTEALFGSWDPEEVNVRMRTVAMRRERSLRGLRERDLREQREQRGQEPVE